MPVVESLLSIHEQFWAIVLLSQLAHKTTESCLTTLCAHQPALGSECRQGLVPLKSAGQELYLFLTGSL